MDQENVSAALTFGVPAARVFAVPADPTTHSAIDGTGWVRQSVDRAPLTEVGQILRMAMHHASHPDGDYRVANKVAVLDPPRAIGWLTATEKHDGHLELRGSRNTPERNHGLTAGREGDRHRQRRGIRRDLGLGEDVAAVYDSDRTGGHHRTPIRWRRHHREVRRRKVFGLATAGVRLA
ncbi:hypothetical protein [Actinomadura rubrisoli]|uniref:hypothetical protein n=1 Tax=Actinomadura rubrisoli TaxID=2530368 RepID=UPI001A9D575E|nr:hypothetical protein [Actinomadura rubrisoli]